MSDDEYQNTDDEFGDDDLVIDEDEDFSEDDYSEQVVSQPPVTIEYMRVVETLKTLNYKPTKYLQYLSNSIIINPNFAYRFTPVSKIQITETVQSKDIINKLSMKPLSLFPQRDIQSIIASSSTTLATVNVVTIREIPTNVVVPSEQQIAQYFQSR